ncbi:MAG: hypothetical protein HC827_15395 [Cyanobacteria bacterium RM1_2_2]|nr:hypothetical protein [Cyanobacteria bacterium RM1_2_2]
MKISSKLFHTSLQSGLGLFGLLMTGACWLASTSMVFAQVDQLDVNNERTSDPFSERGGSNNDAFFDMMHRVQLGNIRTMSEFGQDQQESIGTEAEDFRARQRAVLEQQSQPASEELAPSIDPTNTPQ